MIDILTMVRWKLNKSFNLHTQDSYGGFLLLIMFTNHVFFFILCVYACVCFVLCKTEFASVHICMCLWNPEVYIASFNHYLPLFLIEGLVLNLELTDLARVTGPQVSRILLCLSQLWWYFRYRCINCSIRSQ